MRLSLTLLCMYGSVRDIDVAHIWLNSGTLSVPKGERNREPKANLRDGNYTISTRQDESWFWLVLGGS